MYLTQWLTIRAGRYSNAQAYGAASAGEISSVVTKIEETVAKRILKAFTQLWHIGSHIICQSKSSG